MVTRRAGPIFLLAVVALTATLAACEGAKAPPVVTSSPTATPASTPSPGATATATSTPTPTPKPSAYHLVYRQFGPVSDTIWRFDPANPGERQQLATIGHSEGWGTFASISPKRDAIAYTVQPEGARNADREARAFVLPVGGSPKMVADGVDLRSSPLWSPDGSFLYLRRNSGDAISLIEVDADEGDERELVSVSSSDVSALFPIGLSADGQTLYYAQIASDLSTSFVAYDLAGGQTSLLVVASAQIARDYALSPDGGSIAFIEAGRAFIAHLDNANVTPVQSDLLSGSEQRQPVWRPDGALSLGQLPSGDQPSPALVIDPATGQGSSLAPPDSGFDAPLGWSPEGESLAVRSINGPSQALVLISSQGQRLLVSDEPDFLFVGWI